MRAVIVPNSLHDAIHKKIDEKLNGRPITDSDREVLYSQLLDEFDRKGVIPDFEIVANNLTNKEG